MRIALDFDETITADPHFWSAFVHLAKRYGHSVTIVTFRSPKFENSDIHAFANDHGLTVVCTDGQQKSACHQADVWIDDMPAIIPTYAEIHGLVIDLKLGD